MVIYKKKFQLTILLIFFISIWIIFYSNSEILSFEYIFEKTILLKDYIEHSPLKAFLIYIAVYATLVVCNFPVSSILSLSGGFLFGIWIGAMGILIGATLGSLIVFVISKYFFKDYINQKILVKFPQIKKKYLSNEIEAMMLIRLIPGIPFFIQNLALAGLGSKNFKFLVTTLLGLCPWAFIFSTVGEGLDKIFLNQEKIYLGFLLQFKYMFPIFLIIILIILTILLKKKFKNFFS